jgi:hypothetical protein
MRPTQPSGRWAWATLAAAVLVLSAVWRLETLDRRPLWMDEQFTERVVSGSTDFAALWKVGSQDDYQHPPLAYLGPWLAAHGVETPARLRLPSVVAGLASIALLAALGQLLLDRWTGLFAAFLMGISIYHVDFSQEARPYMAGLAFTLGQYLSLFAFLLRGRREMLVPFAVCAAAALYTYHLALLHVGVAAGVSVLQVADWVRNAERRGLTAADARARCVALGLAFLAVAVVYLPQIPNLVGLVSSRGALPSHVLDVSPRFVHELLQRWGSGSGWTTNLYEAAFAIGALRVAARRDLVALGVLGWLAGPVLVFACIPFSKYFDIRFLISALPAFFLVAAAGVDGAARIAGLLAARVGFAEGATAAARAATLGAAAVAFLVPAVGLYRMFRVAERRCGDFVNLPEVLEAHDRLCADHLVLNTIYAEHQFLVKSLRKGIALEPGALDAFLGSYAFDGGPSIEITRSGDRLMAQVRGRLQYELVPESDTRFFYRVLSERTITFERGADGQIDALVLDSSGGSARALRQP